MSADNAAMARALADVVGDIDKLVDSLNTAVYLVEHLDYSPDLAERLRAWQIVLRAPRADAHRIANSLKAQA